LALTPFSCGRIQTKDRREIGLTLHSLRVSLIVPSLPQAVAAAVAVAAKHGFICDSPETLHAAGNVWVHLAPLPLVAQVPKDVVAVRGLSTAVHVKRDLEVCQWLSSRGLAVGAPSDIFADGPGPHECLTKEGDTILVAFYRYYERARSEDKDDFGAGRALRELHEALREYPQAQSLTELEAVIGEPKRLLGMLQAGRLLPPAQVQLLRNHLTVAERLIATYPRQTVHADVHLQNVITTAAGPLWTDWENVCRAPLLWDLACLVASTQLYGIPVARLNEALRGYGAVKLDFADLKPFIHARVVGVSAWAATRAANDERAAKRLRDGLHWLRHHRL
jgi:Ser/Thr protein kinase RdoA (MazF antagonist)